jgi:hypothetical protein
VRFQYLEFKNLGFEAKVGLCEIPRNLNLFVIGTWAAAKYFN